MSDLKFLVATRGHVRAQITITHQNVSSETFAPSPLEISSLRLKLTELKSSINDYNSGISKLIFEAYGDGESFCKENESVESYNEKLRQCTAILDSVVTANSATSRPGPSVETQAADGQDRVVKPNKLKLPELPLPTYSNSKNETLASFLNSFHSVIAVYNLSSYEKFVFLKKQLRAEPLLLVQSLDISSQSYESAVELLTRAFASDISQKFKILERLSQLKCSHNKPFEFISEMRLVGDLVRTLDIKMETVLQFFVWNGLTSELQSQLISICNSNKPSFKEIEENIFKALDRLKEIGVRNRSPSRPTEPSLHAKVASFAASVNTKVNEKPAFFCSLCSERGKTETSHQTRNCPNYSSPKSKLDRLHFIKGCTLCGYSNHVIADCKFKFYKNCLKCDRAHMTFLCTKAETFPEPNKAQPPPVPVRTSKVKSTPKTVVSGVVWTGAVLQSSVGQEAILPTFSCRVGCVQVRVLKDSGCQSTFIEQSLSDQLNLPVVKSDLEITVHGFNEVRKYKTKEVSVPLNLRNGVQSVNAICVPAIRTSITIPGLSKIVQTFRDKNYFLADQYLSEMSDSISNLKIILGTNDSHILTENHFKFGHKIPSIYSETSEGVLLFGNAQRILDNLSYLPTCSPEQVEIFNNANLIPDNLLQANFSESHTNNDCQVTSVVINSETNDSDLSGISDEILNEHCNKILNYETNTVEEDETELNKGLVKFVLSETRRSDDGRLIMPLLWKPNVSTSLGQNSRLARQILKSNEKKLLNNEDKLLMINNVFEEQERDGVIERVHDEPTFFAENPQHSYLPHMAVFKPDRETTKCRVVFLSNLVHNIQNNQNNTVSLSHNQVMHAGPCLNHKLSTAILHLRFDKYLLCYDVRRAFLQISLSESDSNKLLFYWYKNVAKRDFSLVTWRNLKLPFGLKCSPTLLMLALYKLLCLDSSSDDSRLRRVKELIYALTYVDNGAFTGSRDEVMYTYEHLQSIFEPYKFEVQQVITNDQDLQNRFDNETQHNTERTVKVLGLNWDRHTDEFSTRKISLDKTANTKRKILSTIAQQYDIFGYHAPLLIRARLFMHSLQCEKSLGWDNILSDAALSEWKKIAKQANSSPIVKISRFVGDRSSDYCVTAFNLI